MIDAIESGDIVRISRVILINDQQQILLQKRDNNTKTFWPDAWDSSAAGHVDGGECYLYAAKREMFEEIAHYCSEIKYKNWLLKRFNKVYLGKINFTPENLDSKEVSKVRWFEINDLKNQLKSNPDKFIPALAEVIDILAARKIS